MKHVIQNPAHQQIKEQLQEDFITALRDIIATISANAACQINFNSIEIGIADENNCIDNNSAITIYAKQYTFNGELQRDNELNIGSASNVTPNSEAKYWRFVHAAEILKNWDKVCNIVNQYIFKYRNLLS
jgi:hypothetical protein